MCAILGILQRKPDRAVEHRFPEALELMAHRGPDASGQMALGNVLFGHRRLSIVDLSPLSHQPMKDSSATAVLTFNGEIYNFRELRSELYQNGIKFRTQGDAEVILEGYRHWGLERLLEKLEGMFAFGLFDSVSGDLYLVRDRLGKKPLFYFNGNGILGFSSEIKSLLHLFPEAKRLNEIAVSQFLSYRAPLGPNTFFREIHSLEPGHYLRIGKSQTQKHRYWSLKAAPASGVPLEQTISEVRDRVRAATEKRLMADVPVGAFLSGGLDSTILVAAMAGRARNLKTYSVTFDHPDFDESRYSRMASEHFGTDHFELKVEAKTFLDALPELIQKKDAPSGVQNEAAIYLLAKELRKSVTVVLSGEGADELFGGYGRILRSPFDLIRSKEAGSLGYRDSEFKKKYRRETFDRVADHFDFLYSRSPAQRRMELFAPGFLSPEQLTRNPFVELFDEIEELDPYARYAYVFQTVHLQGLLHRLDTATMAASVEGRCPFVDHSLVELVFGLSHELKLRWKSESDRKAALAKNSDDISEVHDITKWILREAFRGLIPAEIIERRKVGFPVPLQEWLGKDFPKFARSVLLDDSSRKAGVFNVSALERLLKDPSSLSNHSSALEVWSIVNIQLFLNLYGMGR